MQHLQPNTTLQGGKYRIERVLGQGGFGITYLAVQTSLDRNVAIKEFFMKDFCSRDEATRTMSAPSTGSRKLVEQYRKKFIKEARNLARLSHSNIISVIDVFEENGTVYYAMPYLAGGSLLDYVKARGTLSETMAMKYVRQIANALKYMHEEQHICHYDVKPANILIDDNDNAVLIDFGISKNYDAAGHETTTTPVGMSEGYAPIEQYQQNVEEFSPASDVYALGATLYFLLHGKRPVSAVHRASGTALLVSKQLSQGIKDVINNSMKVSKRDRAQSVDVFLGNLNVSDNKKSDSVQNDDEATIIEKRTESRVASSHISSPATESNRDALIKKEANDLKEKILKEGKRKMFFRLLIIFCVSCSVLYSVIVTKFMSGGNFVGDVSLGIFGGGCFGLLLCGGYTSNFINWEKKEKTIIQQWKDENPNDPRNKFI